MVHGNIDSNTTVMPTVEMKRNLDINN